MGAGLDAGTGAGTGAGSGWGWDWGSAAAAGSFAFCKQARRTIQNQMLSMRMMRTAVDFISMLPALASGVHPDRAGHKAHLGVLVQEAALLSLRLLQRRHCSCPAAQGSAQDRIPIAGLELGDGCRLRGRRLGRRDGHGLGRGHGHEQGLGLGLGLAAALGADGALVGAHAFLAAVVRLGSLLAGPLAVLQHCDGAAPPGGHIAAGVGGTALQRGSEDK